MKTAHWVDACLNYFSSCNGDRCNNLDRCASRPTQEALVRSAGDHRKCDQAFGFGGARLLSWFRVWSWQRNYPGRGCTLELEWNTYTSIWLLILIYRPRRKLKWTNVMASKFWKMSPNKLEKMCALLALATRKQRFPFIAPSVVYSTNTNNRQPLLCFQIVNADARSWQIPQSITSIYIFMSKRASVVLLRRLQASFAAHEDKLTKPIR